MNIENKVRKNFGINKQYKYMKNFGFLLKIKKDFDLEEETYAKRESHF